MSGRTSRHAILSEKEQELIKKLDQKRALQQERRSLQMKIKRSETENYRIKEIKKELTGISKRQSEFEGALHNRLLHLKKDLHIILQSKALSSFLIKERNHIYFPTYEHEIDKYPIMASLATLGDMHFRNVDEGSEIIPDYNGWKIKSRKIKESRHYWLSINEEPETGNKDTTSPTYPIIGTKGTWKTGKRAFQKGIKKRIMLRESINIREILIEALGMEKDFPKCNIIPRDEIHAVDIIEIKNRIAIFQKN